MNELYKRLRPKTLSRVVGNEGTVKTLKGMVEKGNVPHTILFSGPSGCGKTTLARILKSELGCLDMDFVEMNCSNKRGVDDIREITRAMKLAPAGPCRVWMLDECHALTKDAQNAALKILEDTPEHVYFFLCTTDPQKLLATIKTRATHLPVSLLDDNEAMKLVRRAAKKVSLTLSEDVRETIVDKGEGSPRKLLVILDKLLSLDPEDYESALESDAGMEASAATIELCRAIFNRKGPSWSKCAKILSALKEDPESVRWGVLGYARSILLKNGSFLAFDVIQAFEEPFFNSKSAGLARAVFEVCNSQDDS